MKHLDYCQSVSHLWCESLLGFISDRALFFVRYCTTWGWKSRTSSEQQMAALRCMKLTLGMFLEWSRDL